MLVLLLFSLGLSAQDTGIVKGIITDVDSGQALSMAVVKIAGTGLEQTTDSTGRFEFSQVPVGEQMLVVTRDNFENQEIPVVVVSGKTTDIGSILLSPAIDEMGEQGVVTLSDDALSDDEVGGSDNISGILQSSKDVFQRAVAFNFGQVWFKTRGYDSNLGQIQFNGMPMNKISNNRPQWSDWGGLNDVLRNQTFTDGLAPSETAFGNVLGSTNFITRASEYRKGGRVSHAFTNSNYIGRAMASYSTGLMKNGWALTVLGSRRYGQEGYVEGTSYNAWGGFLAVEKKLNKNHSLNLTAFYTPNRRGKNSPNTQEVYDLGGTKYNAYWGYQGALKRNARMKEIKEPTFMLGHYWDISEKTSLNTNLMYQMGTIGNSRLEYLGLNPDPTYYQKLPSYSLKNQGAENYEEAYERSQSYINKTRESQILWNELYEANALYDDATFLQYEDVNEDKVMAVNSVLATELNEQITLNASVMYKNIQSENYARVMDLLGAKYFTDKNKYAQGDESQNDLNHPDRRVKEGDKFKYDYVIDAQIADAFVQTNFNYGKVDFYLAGNAGFTSYQRDGKYLNGEYQQTSFGKGELKQFITYGAKAGFTYKISGHHFLNVNSGYMLKAPSLRNTYANSRVSNEFVPNLTTNKIMSGDVSYLYRSQSMKARLTGYYTELKDLTEVTFFYVEGLTGVINTSDFLTTALYGINKKNLGAELGIEVKITPTVKFLGAAAVGEFTYDNNPMLKISASESDTAEFKSYLKNYKQSGTPQRGYSIGFEYRDPKYWWVSANANYLTHNYVGLSTLRRTDNFYKDDDGVPIVGITQEEMDRLLKQERFNDIFLVNVVGGKSWKVNNQIFGFFASVNNLLGEKYKTGGFEQSRKGNFEQLKKDSDLNHPLFGNKYWYGRGTSYYINFYLRF